MNIVIIALTALIPLVIGFIWYHPAVFGKSWMRASGLRQEDMSKGRMWLIFLLAYVFSFMASAFMLGIVIHQSHLYSILANESSLKDPNSPLSHYVKDFMSHYGHNFRTFKHGAFHGTIAALFFALPVIGVVSLFERRRFKYIAIHTGYWIVTLALMGGVICQFFTL